MTDATPIDSPRIAALKAELDAGNRTALDAFWKDIEAQTTPLFEPIPDGKADETWITFVWRGDDTLQHIVVMNTFGSFEDFNTLLMSRLPDTNLWYKTYRTKRDVRSTYYMCPNEPLTPLEPSQFVERIKNWRPDPFNPKTEVMQDDESKLYKEPVTASIIEGEAAVAQPYIVANPDIPAGKLEMHRFASAILGNERRVWVYTPPGYTANGARYGMLLLFDGLPYTTIVPTGIILDNLMAEGKIPPMIAVLPDSIGQEERSRELPCHPPFIQFLEQELVEWVRQHYHVSFNPTHNVVGGSSYGGLASAFTGFHLPHIFGNVLSQSGSYWWKPEDDPEDEWLIRQFVTAEKLPLRFYLDVGQLESRPLMVVTNRHMRDVLRARGYRVQYAEFSGGHDYVCWRGTLADGLLALVGKDQHKAQ